MDDHELRTLRWRNKQLGKQLGKAGQKIHELRCALAEIREINGKIALGRVRALERQVANDAEAITGLNTTIARLLDLNTELREKLQASESSDSDAPLPHLR